jgi:hypothetical protein
MIAINSVHWGYFARPWVVAAMILGIPILLVIATSFKDFSGLCESSRCLTIPKAVGVLANDRDSNGDEMFALLVKPTSHGKLSLFRDGSYTYDPEVGFHGVDIFEYVASDGVASSEVTQVTILVNDKPVPNNDEYWITENTTLTVPAPGVLMNDFDSDDDPLTLSSAASPVHGDREFLPSGQITYVPFGTFVGTDSFTYQVSDGFQLSEPGRITIHVMPAVESTLIVSDDTFTIGYNGLLELEAPGILSNDDITSASDVFVAVVEPPTKGDLAVSDSGELRFVPYNNSIGIDHFSYQVSDGTGVSNTARVVLRIATVVNESLLVDDDTYTLDEDAAFVVEAPGVLLNDTQAPDSKIVASLLTATSNGTVVLLDSGGFSYSPFENFTGSDEFTYVASDENGTSNTATVSLIVVSVNDSPVATDDDVTLIAGN